MRRHWYYSSSVFPLDALDQISKLFVQPLFDYCDIIYHVPVITDPFDSSISLKDSMQSIESTQYQAAFGVSGDWKGSNTSKLYEELGWESLGGTEDSFNFIKCSIT